MTPIIIAFVACCVAGVLFLEVWTYPLLLLASTGFLIMAWKDGARHTPFGKRIFLGLIFCFLGDAIGPSHFIAGAVAFLIAHVIFMSAFINYGLNKRHSILGCVIAIPISIFVILYLWPNVSPQYHTLIIIYTSIITLMVALSAGTQTWILVATIIFYVSDIFVARWKFIGGSHNAYFCYPLYYTACTMLAMSFKRIQGEKNATRSPTIQTI